MKRWESVYILAILCQGAPTAPPFKIERSNVVKENGFLFLAKKPLVNESVI